MTPTLIQHLIVLLSEHPSVVQFRWGPTESPAATWWFLISSISCYISISAAIHLLLRLLRLKKPIPLGPIPALHSVSISLISAVTFAGMLTSSAAEIRDTRWLWQRNKTPFQWLLCFPLGTRPSGRVFFWSYVFYLTRFLHAVRAVFLILRRPAKFPYFQIVSHSVLICMAFLWLEFSQSFQVLAILSMTLVFAVGYWYRLYVEMGVKRRNLEFVMCCQMFLVVTNLAWNAGVLVLHFWKGGCNGMGACLFNAMLNSFVLLFLLNFYVNKCFSFENGKHHSHYKLLPST